MTMPRPYPPVRVRAVLDEPLSRWLWLVKWLLAIPHYIVLVFLWIGFVLVSIVAFFAILFTKRYPRALFDYNVGVLRWTWRVSYYAYGVLATDRYPPFRLKDDPEFPAHFDVVYPGELSRGLVLVKWWLLAIPHYLVIAILTGTSSVGWLRGGLIGILVLIAVVALLFTGRYPRDLHVLVVGLNRWVLRVAAYAALMTDKYPPFRLDMGAEDPATAAATPAPPA